MITDTHCHYNLPPLYQNWQEHWLKAQQRKVTASIVVGTSVDTSQKAMEIARQDDNLKAAIGVHPHEYSQEDFSDHQSKLEKVIAENQKQVVAIGETGLDYFRLSKNDTLAKERQLAAFVGHLQLAEKLKLPAIIHVRDKLTPENPTPGNAYWDVLKTFTSLKESSQFNQDFVLHCISGPESYLKSMLGLGTFVGVAANVTYPKSDQLRKLVASTPRERLLLETDAPFLPPQEFRGKTCEPWMISLTGQYLKSELQIDLAQLEENSRKLFKL